MPRVPIYQDGGVQDQGDTSARLQSADYGAGIGAGIEGLGKATGDFIDKMDAVHAIYDQTDAKQLDIEHLKFVAGQREQLNKVRGADAQPAAAKLTTDLQEYDRQLLERARSPRARLALEQSIASRSIQHTEAMDTYGEGQFVQHTKAVNVARTNALTDDLVLAAPGTPEFEQRRTALRGQIESANAFDGEHDPEVTNQQMRHSMDTVYGSQAQTLNATKGAEAARSFIEDHRDEMFADTANRLLAAYGPEAINDRMERQFREAHGEPTGGKAAAPAADAPAPHALGPARNETMDNPADGLRISSGFGHRSAPTAGASTNHGGWDIPMPAGSEVNSTLSGRVVFAGTKGGYGNTVIIDHGNGLKTQYSHLSSIEVKQGEQVDQGDEVAKSGNTGTSTGPHLHYQVWDHGVPADPGKFVGKDRKVAPGGAGAVQQASTPASQGSLEADLALADRKVDSGEWSPVEAKAWRSAAQQWYGRKDAARAKTEDDAQRGAYAWLNSLPDPDKFTSIGQMPANIVAALNPSTLHSFRAQAESNAKGDKVEVSPQTEYQLAYTRAADPTYYSSPAFFAAMAGKLPAARLRSLASDQGSIRGELASPKPQHTSDGDLLSTAKEPLFAAGYDLSPSPKNAPPGSKAAQNAYDESNQALAALRIERDAWEAAHPGVKADENTKRQWVSQVMRRLPGTAHAIWNATDSEIVKMINPNNLAFIKAKLTQARLDPNDQHLIAEAYRRVRPLYYRKP